MGANLHLLRWGAKMEVNIHYVFAGSSIFGTRSSRRGVFWVISLKPKGQIPPVRTIFPGAKWLANPDFSGNFSCVCVNMADKGNGVKKKIHFISH